MTDKLGDKLGLKLSRIEPALYDEMDDQVKHHVFYFDLSLVTWVS